MSAKPQTKKPILFLDIGSGTKPGRAFRIALRRARRNKKGKIVALDNKPHEPYPAPKNFEKATADAIKYLESLEPGSIRIMNFDLTLATKEQVRLASQFFGKPKESYQNIVLDEKLAKAMHQALAPKGRIFIVTSSMFLENMIQELRKSGFVVSSHPLKKVLQNVQSISPELLKLLKMHPQMINFGFQLVAKKP
jgi:hypothetical protein